MSRWSREFLCGIALLCCCTTPSVPIPPPVAERVTFEVDGELGTVRFRYDPEPSYANAVVYVFNRSIGEGIIASARDDGSVGPTAPFAGTTGDEVLVTFETDAQLGQVCLKLEDGRSNAALECDQ